MARINDSCLMFTPDGNNLRGNGARLPRKCVSMFLVSVRIFFLQWTDKPFCDNLFRARVDTNYRLKYVIFFTSNLIWHCIFDIDFRFHGNSFNFIWTSYEFYIIIHLNFLDNIKLRILFINFVLLYHYIATRNILSI